MSHNVEFIFDLADRISAPLKNISATVNSFGSKMKEIKASTAGTFEKFRTEVNKAAANSGKLPSSLSDIRNKLQDLNAQLDQTHSKKSFVNLKKEIEATNKELHKMENLPPKSFISKIKDLPGQLGISLKAIAGLFAAREIYNFGKDTVRAFDQDAKAAAQLTAGLISTHQAVGRTFGELIKQADELEGKTLFKHDITQEAQSQLMVFSKVRGKVFDDAIVAAQNLATKFKLDLPEATKMVGKALQDPEHGMRLLRMAGINFSSEQLKHIHQLVKAGDLYKVQIAILTGMQQNFGGSAEAAAKAGLGPMQQLSNQWESAKEGIGALVVSLLVKLKPAFEIIIKAVQNLTDWFFRHKWIAIGLIGTIGLLGAAWMAMSAWAFLSSSAIYSAVIPSLIKLGITIKAIPLIGWIITAIAFIGGLIYAFYNFSAKTRGILFGIWGFIKAFFTNLGTFIAETFHGIWTIIKGVLNPAHWFSDFDYVGLGLQQITNAATKFGKAFKKGFDDARKEGESDFVYDQYKAEADKLGLTMAEYKKAKEGARKMKMSVEDYVKSGYNVTDPTGKGDTKKLKPDNTIDTDGEISGIAAGGSKAVNINVTFGKLVEQFIVHAHGLKEGMNEIENQGTEALLRVLNGANKLATKQ